MSSWQQYPDTGVGVSVHTNRNATDISKGSRHERTSDANIRDYTVTGSTEHNTDAVSRPLLAENVRVNGQPGTFSSWINGGVRNPYPTRAGKRHQWGHPAPEIDHPWLCQ